MLKLKYIIVDGKNVIVFPETLNHSQFKHLNPTSAGFIFFQQDANHVVTCKCYGESVTLNLKSLEKDSQLATNQLINNQFS